MCSNVCARGSVKPAPWASAALGFQLRLARRLPLCLAQLPGSHNSAITRADGYGNRDGLFERYLR